jgi:hypothetical protein
MTHSKRPESWLCPTCCLSAQTHFLGTQTHLLGVKSRQVPFPGCNFLGVHTDFLVVQSRFLGAEPIPGCPDPFPW